MSEAEVIAELLLLGAREVREETAGVTESGDPCVAFVGSMKYDEEKLFDFMDKLAAKYPAATIVTGEGAGAEKAVATYAAELGFTVRIPYKSKERWGSDASSIQVFDVCRGYSLWDSIQEEATVLVLVGDPGGSRPGAAKSWWQRIYGREGQALHGARLAKRHHLHVVATLPKEATAKKRAVSKKKREARENA